ncbi:hypothetical protein E2C01_070193 [Portunus trituberculatus]|uniref:Uncharacterized protein n=1 Tax=Portunus trituberculatus TaxID=210409 RepID=A0A5B7I2V4_PORTR|nr:hypothetical protein [Portunus trituberculatus]
MRGGKNEVLRCIDPSGGKQGAQCKTFLCKAILGHRQPAHPPARQSASLHHASHTLVFSAINENKDLFLLPDDSVLTFNSFSSCFLNH